MKKFRRLDGQGRVVLPAFIREELDLKRDSEVTIELLDDGSVRIKPVKKHCCICHKEKEDRELVKLRKSKISVCLDCSMQLFKYAHKAWEDAEL